MKKVFLFCAMLALSGAVQATDKGYGGPDCSDEKSSDFFRIISGITDSLQSDYSNNKKNSHYFDQLIGKGIRREITRLSSEKISEEEARRLMIRRAKQENYSDNEMQKSMLPEWYLKSEIYRQYYLIESSAGFKAIAEYYSAVTRKKGQPVDIYCGADLENIYIISDHIAGHTEDFSSR